MTTSMPSYKELRRSRSDRMVAGVCAGLANYLNADPVAIRVAFAVLTVITGGLALVAYFVAWIVMPEAPAAPVTWPTPPTAPPMPPAA